MSQTKPKKTRKVSAEQTAKTEESLSSVFFYAEKDVEFKILEEDIELLQDKFNVTITNNGQGQLSITKNDGLIDNCRKAAIVLEKLCRDLSLDIEVTEDDLLEYIEPLLFRPDDAVKGRPIYKDYMGNNVFVRTVNQEALYKSAKNYTITIVHGCAGTGKSKLSIVAALNGLKDNRYDKIIIVRPMITVGADVGFLPGDLSEKYGPYTAAITDAFIDLIGTRSFEEMVRIKKIEFAPVAMMRGVNFNNAFVIVDEAQNLTKMEILTVLTRIGYNTKVIITGDESQSDRKNKKEESGLDNCIARLKDNPDVSVVKMTTDDIQRNRIVRDIIDSFE